MESKDADRYVLEKDEHVDAVVTRSKSTAHGDRVEFDDVWSRGIRFEWTKVVQFGFRCRHHRFGLFA